MKTLNVDGLPELVVRALATAVEALRREYHDVPESPKLEKKLPALPLWPGSAPPLETMRREEIYRDVR